MKKSRLQHRTQLEKSLKIYSILLLIISIAVLWYFMLWKQNVKIITKMSSGSENDYIFEKTLNLNIKESVFVGEKIVHIDLKGAPPKITYLKSLFPFLAELGVSGLLIEYEDMFPYKGTLLQNISAFNSYSLDDIKTINKLAKESHLTIIPLIQTFGHMEFILKLEEFKHLREVLEYPQAICPTHEQTLDLIMELVEQIIESHPDSKMIHIGADEVYHIGLCDKCFNTMTKFGWSKNQLFLEHVNDVAQKIRSKYPTLRILMWDDEFRSMSLSDLKNSQISKLVEPVIWKYSKEVYDELGPSLWDMYEQVFTKVWIASAFKGATGSNQYVTDVSHHVQNHRSWMSVVNEYGGRINFQGILITGWQRYDHFAVLCELLPVGLPSLAMSLRLLFGYNDSPLSPPTEVAKKLQCEQPYALMGPAFGSPKCSFPGGDILEAVLHLQQLKQDYETLIEDSRVKGWLSEYNAAYCFSNPQYVQSVTSPIDRIKGELNQVKTDMTAAMNDVYDNYTISEWLEIYIKPFEDKMQTLWEAKNKLLVKNNWPRRPLTLSDAQDCKNLEY